MRDRKGREARGEVRTSRTAKGTSGSEDGAGEPAGVPCVASCSPGVGEAEAESTSHAACSRAVREEVQPARAARAMGCPMTAREPLAGHSPEELLRQDQGYDWLKQHSVSPSARQGQR